MTGIGHGVFKVPHVASLPEWVALKCSHAITAKKWASQNVKTTHGPPHKASPWPHLPNDFSSAASLLLAPVALRPLEFVICFRPFDAFKRAASGSNGGRRAVANISRPLALMPQSRSSEVFPTHRTRQSCLFLLGESEKGSGPGVAPC